MVTIGMSILASGLTRLASGAPKTNKQNKDAPTSTDVVFQMVLDISSCWLRQSASLRVDVATQDGFAQRSAYRIARRMGLSSSGSWDSAIVALALMDGVAVWPYVKSERAASTRVGTETGLTK